MEAPPGTCNSQHTANCHYTRLLLSRSFHKIFSKLHPQALTRAVLQEAEKPRLLLLITSSFPGLPNLPVWRPVNICETLGISCPSIPQYTKEMGKENCLSHPLPSFSMPVGPTIMYTPVPKHIHPHPGSCQRRDEKAQVTL